MIILRLERDTPISTGGLINHALFPWQHQGQLELLVLVCAHTRHLTALQDSGNQLLIKSVIK